jgi:hypothetical protein
LVRKDPNAAGELLSHLGGLASLAQRFFDRRGHLIDCFELNEFVFADDDAKMFLDSYGYLERIERVDVQRLNQIQVRLKRDGFQTHRLSDYRPYRSLDFLCVHDLDLDTSERRHIQLQIAEKHAYRNCDVTTYGWMDVSLQPFSVSASSRGFDTFLGTDPQKALSPSPGGLQPPLALRDRIARTLVRLPTRKQHITDYVYVKGNPNQMFLS